MHGLPFGVDSPQTTINPIWPSQQAHWRELNQAWRRLAAPLARDTEVVLLVVNPEVLHVYWHIDSPHRLVLRLHDLATLDLSGCNPHHSFDWQILSHTGKAYLRLPGGNRHVLAEIGEPRPYRRLSVLLRSHTIHLPVARQSRLDAPELLSGDLAEFPHSRLRPPVFKPHPILPCYASTGLPDATSPTAAYGY